MNTKRLSYSMGESDKFADAGGHTAGATLPCSSWVSSSLHTLLFWLFSGDTRLSSKANEDRFEGGDDNDVEKSRHDSDTQAILLSLVSSMTLLSTLGAMGISSVRPSCFDVVR